MRRKHLLPFFGFALLALVGYSVLASTSLHAQDADRGRRAVEDPRSEQRLREPDDQRERSQQPRQRGPATDEADGARQSDAGQLDRPSARVVPPGTGWGGDRWVLGVTTQTNSTGVRVRSVMPGSPASRVGLERDDVIVTVDGFQVGRVGPRNYPLGEELQFRAGRRGDVLLLVQNRRNDQLLALPVQLTRRAPFDDWPRRRERGDRDFFQPRLQNEDVDRQSPDDAPIE